MKYIIDIDDTICEKPQGNSDYESSVPKVKRIEMVNKLYQEGHKITYFTARGMGRNNDDSTAAQEQFFDLTKQQLDSWGCLYHNLILGKPSGDIYIDDKGVNSDDFFGD